MNNIGLVGLGVMGQNLILNFEQNGFSVSVFNRTYSVTQDFINNNSQKRILGLENIKDFILSLERPRKIIMLVKAGQAVDDVITEILPYLESGDILVDSGNSYYKDTEKRYLDLKTKNIKYIGLGISGGEVGARTGASFMAGGDLEGYKEMYNILSSASAKDFSENRCIGYFGEGGAGHFVKMIHNGIEYVDMQLIADVYTLLRINNNNDQIQDILAVWENGRSKSYLLEITKTILNVKDTNGSFLIDNIDDITLQKGTGQWASQTALEIGVPSYSFSSSVFSRYLSASKQERLDLSKIYNNKENNIDINANDLEGAYYISKIIAYVQGFEIIKRGSEIYNWDINLSEASRIWQGGCIIRAELLKTFCEILKTNNNILENAEISKIINNELEKLLNVLSISVKNLISVPGFISSYEYFSGYTTEKSSSNLISAQRDFFGAHGYKRIDGTDLVHTEWESSLIS